MTPQTTVTISLIISIISAFGVVVSIMHTFKTDHEADSKKELKVERNFVEVKVRLETLTEAVNKVARDNDKSVDELKTIREEFVKQGERIETLFKYKDDHENRLRKLEDEK